MSLSERSAFALRLRHMTTYPNPYRLDRNVVPSAYRIFLTPDLEQPPSPDASRSTSRSSSASAVKLNAIELDLGAATVSVGGDDVPLASTPASTRPVRDGDVRLRPAAARRTAVVEIAFTGILNDQLHGFYRSTFTDADGVTHTIATTQFENTDARRAFPCWDEPAFKATYQVNLTVPSHLAAYSNSPDAPPTPTSATDSAR